MATETATTYTTALYAYTGALVDELARAGVRHACICPGSRSTPLALTLAEHPAIQRWIHIDERSAAFFALGLAKASGMPAALICTSGTAAANFLPAIVEARYGRVPLVVLTADRPPELRDNGAPQAIDQLHLYGGNVKWFAEMALPEATDSALRYARATAARAVATALEGPRGPVHVNLPFREPLVPPRASTPAAPVSRDNAAIRLQPTEFGMRLWVAPPQSQALPAITQHQSPTAATPGIVAINAPRMAPAEAIREVARSLAVRPRGIIVCGEQHDPALAPALTRLASLLGYPILADPLSGLRRGAHDHALVLDAYDAFLRDERATALTPELALRFGATPTSKTLLTFLQRVEQQVLVDGDGGWRDPIARATMVIHADAALLCTALAEQLYGLGQRESQAWCDVWQRADCRAREAIDSYLTTLDEPFEGKVFAAVADLLPEGATLYAGNSMPVRDLETFFPGGDRALRFLGNRGANGIDGVISSALGAAAAGDGPLVLVIGDLSFYHDLNGLLAARRYPLNATIVLLNNDGGGIFSFLPQVEHPEHFEQLFGTPTGLGFQPAVEMYGCAFQRVATWPAFRAAVAASLAAPGVQVIEMRTERARNVELHRAVWHAVAEAVWRA